MSVFCVYFEVNNSQNSWDSYLHKKEQAICDTFTQVKSKEDMLNINSIDVRFFNKNIRGYLIHDNVSSDKVLEGKINTPLVILQRKTMFNFLIRRRTLVYKDNYLMFHLFNEYEIEQLTIDNGTGIKVIAIDSSDATLFKGLQKEILYRIDNG